MTDRATPLLPRHRPRLRRGDESGAAIVEFSLVFVLFVFLIYALIAFGMILATKHRVTSAAAGGARAAVGAVDFAQAQTLATQRVRDDLGAPGKYSEIYTDGLCDTGNPTGPRCITVQITYDYEHNPIVPVPKLPGLNLFTPASLSSKAVVQWSA